MSTLTNGQCAQLACMLEVTARKPGNVHRFADFEDSTFLDFLVSAAAIAGPMGGDAGVGEMILASVRATRRFVGTNTNLGMILLLAPLAVARRITTLTATPNAPPRQPSPARGEVARGVGRPEFFAANAAEVEPSSRDPGSLPPRGGGPGWGETGEGAAPALRQHLRHVLASLTLDDARHVYAAIRLAHPGGLGQSDEQDVSDEPTVTLLDAMRLAADRDVVARQYANDFAEVFETALPALRSAIAAGLSTESAIIHAYLTLLSRVPDTLIARKIGREMAEEVSRRAAEVLSRGESIDDFDRWLRADGHRRNPGATADLIAAALFLALADGTIQVPGNLSGGGFKTD